MLLGVDVGGTFTDAVVIDGDTLHRAKVPSTPADQSIGVLAAIEAVLTDAGGARELTHFAHGMTVATNALLEGRGARTALVATEGFTDLVELGRQARAELYRLCAAHPAPLAPPELRFAACERTGPHGVLRPLEDTDRLLEELTGAAPEAIAVVLLHAYAYPEHERLIGQLLSARLPGVHVSLSHEVVGTFREFERAATTEIDAALSPLLAGYLRRLERGAAAAGLPAPRIMQSSGGLASLSQAADHAALTVLSGPAGGVEGARLLAQSAGAADVLCFDMGGTSCDVCVIEQGAVHESAGRSIGGRPLALAMLDIHTVGAGGGSVAWRDAGGALRVGPRSAGAQPGPACYGRGGREPTVTDANLLLGRLPTNATLPLDRELARTAVAQLAAELGLDPMRCAEGIIRVADTEMLHALRVVSVERGIDPRGYALLAFGGAGPLHAASLAEALGIERILCPQWSGVLSALGLAAAAPRHDAASSHGGTSVAALRELVARRLGEPPQRERITYELRYRGQSFELAVQAPPDAPVELLRRRFEDAHESRFGYHQAELEVELVTVRVSAWGAAPQVTLTARPGALRRTTTVVWWEGAECEAELLIGDPPAGLRVVGPAIVALGEATLFIAPGWIAEARRDGTIELRR